MITLVCPRELQYDAIYDWEKNLKIRKKISIIQIPQIFTHRNTQMTCILNNSFISLLCLSNDLPDSFARKEKAVHEKNKVIRNTFSKSAPLADAVALKQEQKARLVFPKEDVKATEGYNKNSQRCVHTPLPSLLSMFPVP